MRLHLLGQSEITELDCVVATKEDVFGFEITMQDGHLSLLALKTRCFWGRAQYVRSHLRGVSTVMTPEQSSDKLGQNAPDEFLLGILVCLLQVLDHHTQVSTSTVLHVEV